MTRPIQLVILDGFGLAPAGPGNAVALARTPVFDRIWRECPHTTLAASGEAVGLPAGQMGNSEVGHMNIGAGRVVRQSLTHVRALIDDGTFFENPVLLDAYAHVTSSGTLHLMGLVSDGGVHSDLSHLLALIELARRTGVRRLRVHAFTDGRDSAPDGGVGYLRVVEDALAGLHASTGCDAAVGTVVGRYYAMDRDKRWQRTQVAYDAVVCGLAQHRAPSGVAAVADAYARGETDEFIAATVVGDASPSAVGAGAGASPGILQGAGASPGILPGDGASPGILPGDAVVFFNFRADRARQLTSAIVEQGFTGFERCRAPAVRFVSLMEYDPTFAVPYAFSLPVLDQGLSETVAGAGLRQYHTAETEKYAHVTYFFNLQREEPFTGEERVLVPSPKVATYDLQPAMSAPELAERTSARIASGSDDFVLVNIANPDMVGHAGVLAAAVAACEATDAALGRLLDAVAARGGASLVIADHGNAEVMLTEAGLPHTAHTTSPVPCVLVSDDPRLGGASLLEGGALCDVAPTVLDLLGIEQPAAMTGRSLVRRAG